MESAINTELENSAGQPSPVSIEPVPIPVRVFANSGHHFVFSPFTDTQLASDTQANSLLASLCQNNTFPWRQVCDKRGNPVRWILYRFGDAGRQGNPSYGVVFAIETNLGNENRGWICHTDPDPPKSSQPQTATPAAYAFPDIEHLPKGGIQKVEFLLPTTKDQLPREKILATSATAVLEIHWQNPIATPVDVDLVVDFGNTRSVALLLERSKAANGALSEICRPLVFWGRDEEPGRPDANSRPAVIDSWLALQEPLFACLEPLDDMPLPHQLAPLIQLKRELIKEGLLFKKKVEKIVGRVERIPHMFVGLSPAVLGDGANPIVVNLNTEAGGNYFLSSPKRYLWDDTPVGEMAVSGLPWWTMYPQQWHPHFEKIRSGELLEKLSGTILRFMDPDGKDWTLDKDPPPPERQDQAARPVPKPEEPCYPRSDAVTWAALTILETALRQLRAKAGRPAGQDFIPARLASVIVTFPPGWTAQELEAYRCKWQKAVDIFTMANFPDRRLVSDGGDRPELKLELDEAVASQLPLIYGEIERLGHQGENWLEIVGRGSKAEARARVLNLDIGGGTTDIAVIEYQDLRDGVGVDLRATILFRDSSTVAGDVLVQRIIERVLLPAIAPGDPALRQTFSDLLGRQKRGGERQRWSKISRLVFVPIVRGWLGNLATEDVLDRLSQTPAALGVNLQALEDFNEACNAEGLGNLLAGNSPLYCLVNEIHDCVSQTFEQLFRSLAKIVEAFDCDLAIVSGKPSEIYALRVLLQAHVPLLPQRIIFAKNFAVGSWYPLSLQGRIEDAKTVTVAGAALFQAISCGLLRNWTIMRAVSPHLLTRNFWGTMPIGTRTAFGQVCLESHEDEKTCRLQIGQRIGRRLLPADTRPEPVYELQWQDRSRFRAGGQVAVRLDVTLRRVLPPPNSTDGATAPPAERLEIVKVEGTWNGRPVTKQDVRLALCTLETESHWLDEGRFEVLYPQGTTAATVEPL